MQLAPRELSLGRNNAMQSSSAVTSPRCNYSPGVYLYRKNSLSMKQKPVSLANCFHIYEDISRLDVVQDSLVHETRVILELMSNRQKSSTNSPAHMHRLRAKLPIRTRESDEVDRTCSTIEANRLQVDTSRVKVRTEMSQAKKVAEIEDTAEYKCWLNRYRTQPAEENRKLKENRQPNAPNKQVNISVRLVGRRFTAKPPAEKQSSVSSKQTKKRSIAL